MNPDPKFSDLDGQRPPQKDRKGPFGRKSNFSRIGVNPPLVVANWKMHGTQAEAATLTRQILNGGKGIRDVEVVLAPPFTALSTVSAITIDSAVQLAAQNIHWEMEGAFTGEVSPKMVRELLGIHSKGELVGFLLDSETKRVLLTRVEAIPAQEDFTPEEYEKLLSLPKRKGRKSFRTMRSLLKDLTRPS